MANLLRDVYSYGQLQILSEGKSGCGPMKVRGRFQKANLKNQNGRIYDSKILRREVDNLQKMISERRLVGELDHPTDEVVHLTNASHLITGLHMEGDEVVGEAEVLNTPAGQVLKELLSAGVKVGISSRGVVGLSFNEERDAYMVYENLRLITWDMVSDPSCQDAFPGLMEGVISENRQKIDKGVDHARAERVYIHALSKHLNKK